MRICPTLPLRGIREQASGANLCWRMIWAIIAPACRPRRRGGGVRGGGVWSICACTGRGRWAAARMAAVSAAFVRARGGWGADGEAGGSARRAGHQALSGRMATGAPQI